MKGAYLMACRAVGGVRYVKVGITTDIRQRVDGIQTGCPLPLDIVWYFDLKTRAAQEVFESEAHVFLENRLSFGEWFEYPDREDFAAWLHLIAFDLADRFIGSNVRIRRYELPPITDRHAGYFEAHRRRRECLLQDRSVMFEPTVVGNASLDSVTVSRPWNRRKLSTTSQPIDRHIDSAK